MRQWDFIRVYGMDSYRNALYQTSDHVIPAAWFDLAMDALPHLEARQGRVMLQAWQLAYASCRSKEPDVRRGVEDLWEMAAGTVYVRKRVPVDVDSAM